MNNLSLCNNCNCMTKTINNKCGKCKETKPSTIEQNWVKDLIRDYDDLVFNESVNCLKTPSALIMRIKKLLQSQRTKLIDEIVGDFEANVLDGDKIDDCGKAMISSEMILEWFNNLRNKN